MAKDKLPPPAKKKAGKKKGRDFRGMKNGVKDSGPGPIAQAMGIAPGTKRTAPGC